ncbi:MAG: glutamate synthase-related protein, partial [Bradymonadaceae bacterium]
IIGEDVEDEIGEIAPPLLQDALECAEIARSTLPRRRYLAVEEHRREIELHQRLRDPAEFLRPVEPGAREQPHRIAIDGGEGGTGAAPLVFADRVALPFKIAFGRVYRIFDERGIADKIVFAGSGKLGFPEAALLSLAMGCDMIGMAREPMLAIGCIQAQRCHTGQCPAGIATQSKWLMRGLDPAHKAARLANYMVTLRKEIMWITRAAGLENPAQITLDHFEIVDEYYTSRSARDVFGYPPLAAVPQATTVPRAPAPQEVI